MKTLFYYFLTKIRLWGEGKSMKAKCERDGVTLIRKLGGKDSDIEILFHYVWEALYLFEIGALETDYSVVRKLHAFFYKFSKAEADRHFDHKDFEKYRPSEFIALIAYTLWQSSELKSFKLTFIPTLTETTQEEIDRTESIKRITQEVQILANKVFPNMEDKMVFFGRYYVGNFTLILSETRKHIEQKITYRKK